MNKWIGILTVSAALSAASATDLTLWFNTPATTPLNEGLMIGNGRLGGIVLGNVTTDRIVINEDSLWTGDVNVSGDDWTMGNYQFLGDLYVDLPGHSSFLNYRRELDIGQAVARVTYTSGGIEFTRAYFSSKPDEVMIVRLTANASGAHAGAIRYTDSHGGLVTASSNTITVSGTLNNDGNAGLKYGLRLIVLNDGGTVSAGSGRIQFTNCTSLTLILAAGTDYALDAAAGFRGPDPHAGIAQRALDASLKSHTTLLNDHIQDYQSLFNRVAFQIGSTPVDIASLPTNERIAHAGQGLDPELEALLFQYGRYLLIASSRSGGLPANLQGLWNDSNTPPWHSDYHSNINIEMNYWLAEIANLSECHLPFFDLVRSQLPVWRQRVGSLPAAEIPNGIPRGWTLRTSHNIYGGMGWNWNKPANAWYALHLWEHFAFTRDTNFLRAVAFPVLEEVCQFWQDDLKTITANALVVPYGWSPEHGPNQDGVSYDQEIVWNLFNNYIQASHVLETNAAYRATISDLKERLVKPKIGSWGQLQEWMEDIDDPNDQHRHTSHLFAVYPGSEINLAQTPALATAAKVSLIARGESGDSQRPWVWAWRCGLWARFHDGHNARRMIRNFFTYNMLPNLIGSHPPAQWDGNFGITGVIGEMLAQSHAGEIHLLPALPPEWPAGSVTGLRARGGFTVDLAWTNGWLSSATIHSTTGTSGNVRYGSQTNHFVIAPGGSFPFVPAAPAAPDIPSGLTATPGDNKATLSWNAVSGASAYNIRRAPSAGGLYTMVASNAPGTYYIAAGLTNGTTNYFVVSAVNSFGESGNSSPVMVALALPPETAAVYAFEGNALDSSGSGNHGAAYNVTYATGKVGALAAQFNGSSSYVQIPRSISTDFTVAMWVKTTSTGGSGTGSSTNWWNGRGLVDGEVGGAAEDWGTVVLGGRFRFGVGNPDTTISSSVTIHDGAWHHVAATRDNASGVMAVYVDGVPRGSGLGPAGARTAPPSLRIGSLQTGNQYLSGTLDDVRLYARVLGPAEIAAMVAPPATPTNLTAIAGDSRVILNWAGVAGAAGYNVKRSATTGGGYSVVATNLPGPAFTNAGLVNGTMYYYVVSATNGLGESANSDEVSARPVSAAPVQVGFNLLPGDQVQLLWPNDHIGWRLASQTNPAGAGLGKDWHALPDSELTNYYSLQLDRTQGSVFLKLVYP